ncbi:MAG: tetratricopeptide repeat protein [Bacteroidales bacterium]|nr:tetratricopeptide repeat protein [Bacteroidales bacterium]
MKSIKLLSITVALLGLTVAGSAQTLQEVTDARNKGAELMAAGDYGGAITELEKCVDIAKKAGAEADEHRIVAEGALPNLYLQKADKVDSKDYPAVLKALEEAKVAAEKYNNAEVKAKVDKAIPMVYLGMGSVDFQAKKFLEAIASLDQATTLNPDMAKAYFIKGASYQSLKEDDKMIENYTFAIEKANATGDAATAKSATAQLNKFFFNNGITAMKVKKWDEAIAAFNKAVEVDPAYADAYYRATSCYNNKKDWNNAITNGEKALELRAGDDAKATDGIYYELGTAYAGKGDNGKACESFRKVVNEPFLKGAKYQIETALKCK